jgi:hypothetical protein
LEFNTIALYESSAFDSIEFKESFFTFCKAAFEEKDQPAHSNMWDDDWQTNDNTILYHLFVSKRLCCDTGETFVLMEGKKILAVSSIYISPFDKHVAIGGVRSWVVNDFRGKFMIGRYLLPLQLTWAKNKKLKTIALTFNEYNRDLINYFKRSGFGIKKNRNPSSLFYNGLYEVKFPINLQYTKQWAIYHKIDEEYEPDWGKIKWVENCDK